MRRRVVRRMLAYLGTKPNVRQQTRPTRRTPVWVVSRCAWTLYNFRLGLLRAVSAAGGHVVALGAEGDGFENRLQDLGIDFQSIPVDRQAFTPFTDLALFWRLWLRLRRERPELVHLFTIKPVVYGGFAARLARVRTIATITGLGYVFTTGHPLLRLVAELLYRLSLRNAHTVFFQNQDDCRFFLKRRIVRQRQARLVSGSGVDTRRFVPPLKTESVPPVFLMIARLIREKGVLEYIEAAALVRKVRQNVRCLLVGAPDPRNPTAIPVENIHSAVASGNIEWSGATNDVRPWIAQADVVVLPSYREGMPRSLLEAAAMARAIIATDVAGCREVVADEVNGLLVPARDVDALVAAMLRFVEEPNLARRYGMAGRERAVGEFDEGRVIAKTLAAYKDAGVHFSREV